MSYLISNTSKAYAKENADTSYNEVDFEKDYGSGWSEESWGETEDSYIGSEMQTEETHIPLSSHELRQWITQLISQVKASDLTSSEKNEIRRKLEELIGHVNHAMSLGEKTEAELITIQEISDGLQKRIAGVEPNEILTDADSESSLVVQIKEFKEKIENDNNLEDVAQSKLTSELNKMIASAELHKGDEISLSMLEEKLYTMNEEYMSLLLNGSAGKANKLADQLGVSVEQVVAAAETEGVDLENVKVDDKLMKMLQALNVPSAEDLSSYGSLRDKRTQAVKELNLQGDAQTQNWRADSERLPDVNIWRQLYQYYSHADDYSVQMKDITNKMFTQLSGALQCLDLQITAGTKTGQININGNSYDFLNEDAGVYKLDTVFNELTDPYYSPAPRNTEAGDYWSDEAGDYWATVGHNSTTVGGAGYPTVTFSCG